MNNFNSIQFNPLQFNPLQFNSLTQQILPIPIVVNNNYCIQISNAEGILGYLQNIFNTNSEYGLITPQKSNALQVQVIPAGISGISYLLASNPPDETYPYIGAYRGSGSSSNNLDAGSLNYVVLVGTKQIVEGAATVNDVSVGLLPSESAIWLINDIDGSITPNWINMDTSVPIQYIVYVFHLTQDEDYIVLTGDPELFNEKVANLFEGIGSVVTFKLVSV
jgi:hypothetical protein